MVYYHPNQTISYLAFYNKSGLEEGLVQYFYNNCQIEFEYTAKNGIPTSEAIRYKQNGEIKEIITFDEEGKVLTSERFE